MMPLPPESLYHVPRPRGRPPLADRQRNRLTLKLSGTSNATRAVPSVRPEPDDNEQQLEEQFILRVLPSMSASFAQQVSERRIQDSLRIKFLDQRNAEVAFGGKRYAARLVDLPTVSETYRTVDRKQMLKTADVCQMLLVEREISEDEVEGGGGRRRLARGLDNVFNDGLAEPLRDVRRTRFRRRMPETKVDAVEREVLRLLEDDAQALAVKHEVYDELQAEDGRGATPGLDILSPVTMDDLMTPLVADEDASSVAEDLEFDENLAAELEQGLEEMDDDEEEEEDDDEEDDEEESDDDDDEQPGNERAMQIRLLGEETAELERMIQRKNDDLDSAPNPIIRRRFEDIIQRLRQELEAKRQQLEQYREEAAAGASAGAGTGAAADAVANAGAGTGTGAADPAANSEDPAT
ncbi:hypothetical protein LPJ53_005460 [Coemansia erecta]|uniref:TAFII55 protein conserved region domain-containing protein n=1 Tax=Coemansia erecta TaxID=147472 RepID=A0A9W7XWU1_9FUNG|nr:hypothetical protein LPJ53_005460 [Coemansia erecta]